MKTLLTGGVTKIALVSILTVALAVSAVTFANTDFRASAMIVSDDPTHTSAAVDMFLKLDGIDGESQDSGHKDWINISSMSLGYSRPTGGATGSSRRRGAAIVEDMTFTMEYEKAAPKLAEALLKGRVIPKVEIHHTATYGGARATYLKYELKNVMITSYQVNAVGHGETRPTVQVSLNFEEVKVTYTEYDAEGSPKGNVEYSWKVEEGSK